MTSSEDELLTFEEWKKLMQSAESSDRSFAADMLPRGEITPEVTELLLKALFDEDALVRTCAADSLGSIDNDAARSGLRTALSNEKDGLARRYIAGSLGTIGDLSDMKILVDGVLKENESEVAKIGYALGIADLAVDYAFETITKICDSSDWKLRMTAFVHLNGLCELFNEKIQKSHDVAKSRNGREESHSERESVKNILSRTVNFTN